MPNRIKINLASCFILLIFSVLVTFPLYLLPQLSSFDYVILAAEFLEQFRLLGMIAIFLIALVLLTMRRYLFAFLHVMLTIYSVNIITGLGDRFLTSVFHNAAPSKPISCVAKPEKPLTVLSFNVFALNKSYERILELLKFSNADIILLQESQMDLLSYLQPHLETRYPFSYPTVDKKKMAAATLYSRYPITNIKLVKMVRSGQFILHAKILWKNVLVNMIGVHPLSPVTPQRIQNRNKTTEDLADYLRLPLVKNQPLIIAGDFNSVTWYPELKNLMQEQGLQGNTILNYFGTWPTWMPSFLTVPIDHILYNRFFSNAKYWRSIDSGSDHYPVFAQFTLCKSEAVH